MKRALLAAAAGYLLGTRAGRGRYEQIATAGRRVRTLATHPAVRRAVRTGTRRVVAPLRVHTRGEQ